MARIMEFDEVQQQEFDAWVAARPPQIQAMIQNHPPDRLYRNKAYQGTQRVVITAYHEDDTLSVAVLGMYNCCAYERNVFGVKPSDLEECDLPAEGELLGAALTDPDQIEEFINIVRPAVLAAKGTTRKSL